MGTVLQPSSSGGRTELWVLLLLLNASNVLTEIAHTCSIVSGSSVPGDWARHPLLWREAAFSDSQVRYSFIRETCFVIQRCLHLHCWGSENSMWWDCKISHSIQGMSLSGHIGECAVLRRRHCRWAPETWHSVLFLRLLILFCSWIFEGSVSQP